MTVENQHPIENAPEAKKPEIQEIKKDEVAPAQEDIEESIAMMKLKTKAYNILAQIDNHNMQINQLRQGLQQVNEKIIIKTQEEVRKGK